LFKRGANLKDGLIDISRAYTVVSRIKTTSKERKGRLDLNQVVNELLSLNYFEDRIEDGTSEEEKWEVVIGFMKEHQELLPKLIYG
jgi:hypothetical protein